MSKENQVPGSEKNEQKETPPPLEDLSSWKKKRPHEILGVALGSTQQEIKSAFRRMSVKYHPDRVGKFNDPKLVSNYEELYKLISGAYDDLSSGSSASQPSYHAEEQKKETSNASNANTGGHTHYQDFNRDAWRSEKKDVFDEQTEVAYFVGLLINELNDYSIPRLKGKLDELLKKGANKENLIKKIESILLQFYTAFVKENIDNSFALPRIAAMMVKLSEFGVPKEKFLKSNQDVFINRVVAYTQNNIQNQFEIPRIIKLIDNIADLGIKREELTRPIENIVVKQFSTYVANNVSNIFEHPRIVALSEKFRGLGVPKEVLVREVQGTILGYFQIYVAENCKYKSEHSRIKKALESFIQLGVDANQLYDIANKYNIA